jgi:protein tyrosine/serine phosphatase
MLNRRAFITSALTVALASPGFAAQPDDLPGVPNFHQINPSLFRSGQPTKEGFLLLQRDYKIATVVSLRHWHLDKDLLKGTGIRAFNVPMDAWNIKTRDLLKALTLIRDYSAKAPVLLHCLHGADRTGLVAAIYRVIFENWSISAAKAELQREEFGFHALLGNIPAYLDKLDVKAFQKQLL